MKNRVTDFLKFTLSIFAMLSLCACATTEVSDNFPSNVKVDSAKPVALISAENYGYYLFAYLPLFAGNPEKPNENTMTFFEDTASLANNHSMINFEAKKIGADKLSSIGDTEEWTGGFSLWIIWKKTIKSSAMATVEIPSQDTVAAKK